MNVDSAVEKVSIGMKENVTVNIEYTIVREHVLVKYVRINVVYVVEKVFY